MKLGLKGFDAYLRGEVRFEGLALPARYTPSTKRTYFGILNQFDKALKTLKDDQVDADVIFGVFESMGKRRKDNARRAVRVYLENCAPEQAPLFASVVDLRKRGLRGRRPSDIVMLMGEFMTFSLINPNVVPKLMISSVQQDAQGNVTFFTAKGLIPVHSQALKALQAVLREMHPEGSNPGPQTPLFTYDGQNSVKTWQARYAERAYRRSNSALGPRPEPKTGPWAPEPEKIAPGSNLEVSDENDGDSGDDDPWGQE